MALLLKWSLGIVFSVSLCITPLLLFAQNGSGSTTPEQQISNDLQKQIQSIVESYDPDPNNVLEGLRAGSGSLDISPNIPQPGEEFLVSFSNHSHNLQQATIQWYQNGVLFDSGIGLTSVTLKAPAAGEQMIVSIVATTQEGQELQENIQIIPGSIDVLWETDTYTPSLYQGKALYTPQSSIKLVAQPNVGPGDPNTFEYTWYRRGNRLGDKSGRGRRSITLDGGLTTRDLEMRVEVKNPTNGAIAQRDVVIESHDPEIVLYQESPSFGLQYHQALEDSVSLQDTEMTLVAEPYFFTQGQGEPLEYQWEMNNEPLPISSNRLTVRNESGGGGRSQISLDVEISSYLFQDASAQTVILTEGETPTAASPEIDDGFFF